MPQMMIPIYFSSDLTFMDLGPQHNLQVGMSARAIDPNDACQSIRDGSPLRRLIPPDLILI